MSSRPPSTVSTPPSGPSLALRRAALVLVALLIACLAGELACRVLAQRHSRGALDVAFTEQRTPDPNRRVALLDILRMSDDDRVIFELRPNLKGVLFKDAPVTTNSHGFRGPEMPVKPPPDTVTIVGLGDSVMFGYGLPDGRDYISLLERRLQHKYPQKQWRCINAAAPAYNTVNEIALLKSKFLEFEPDLVILGMVPNDLVLPPYIRVVDDVFALDRSFLYERLVDAWQRSRQDSDGPGRDSRLLATAEVQDKQKIPERYRALAGFDAFQAALDELDQMSRDHEFTVVTFSNTEDDTARRMIHAAARRGWLHVPLLPEIQAYLARHGGGAFSAEDPSAYLKSALALSPDDGHPSALQNVMAAEKLMAELERSGIIEQLLQ